MRACLVCVKATRLITSPHDHITFTSTRYLGISPLPSSVFSRPPSATTRIPPPHRCSVQCRLGRRPLPLKSRRPQTAPAWCGAPRLMRCVANTHDSITANPSKRSSHPQTGVTHSQHHTLITSFFGEAPFKGAEPPVLPFLLISRLARNRCCSTTQRC